MNIEIKEIIELVKQVKPLFMDQERASQITVKGVSDFVTNVDFRVQELMKEALGRLYPQVQFMGEEKDNSDIDFSKPVWILDPVDGTTNLIHDFKDSALSLGLCENKTITMGIVYQPFLDELFTAQKGGGAYCNGKRIHVSNISDFGESLITVGTSPYHRELTVENFELFREIYSNCVDIRRMGAASVDLAYVAAGRIEAYFEKNLKPWDFAAGKLLVEEAGGCVTDFSGIDADVSKAGDIAAGNKAVHKILVEKYLKKQLLFTANYPDKIER